MMCKHSQIEPIRLYDVIVIGGGTITHSGSADDILPKILTDTLGSCPVLTRGGTNA